MPVYLYEVVTADGTPGERFEVVQRMADATLTQHPETGVPVKRVITAPAIGTKFMDMNMQRNVKDDDKLKKLGFTKYEKSGDGQYVKSYGKGPNLISK